MASGTSPRVPWVTLLPFSSPSLPLPLVPMAQGRAGDLGLGAELPRGGEIQTGPVRRRRMSSVDAAGNPLPAFTSATSLLFRTLGPAASPSRSPGALLGKSLV
ncbi:hypothetical protein ZWY2020_028403 [Hordeum vulgare]|nr:hypothetical protein ZWY2020_028403 [Hordeum vulgare]